MKHYLSQKFCNTRRPITEKYPNNFSTTVANHSAKTLLPQVIAYNYDNNYFTYILQTPEYDELSYDRNMEYLLTEFKKKNGNNVVIKKLLKLT